MQNPDLNHTRDALRITYLAVFVDALLGFAKVAAGFVVGSAALIADGVHSFSDLITDGFVLAATHYGRQAPDQDHHYGHGRIETLATLFLGSVLIFVAGGIAWSSLGRLLAGTETPPPGLWALLLVVAALFIKEGLFQITMRVARRQNSRLLEANAWHSRSDVLSTAVVLVAMLGTQYGITWLDAVAAVLVGLLVGKIGWSLLWDSGRELIDTALPLDEQRDMKEVTLGVPGVESVHDLRTRQSAGRTMLDLHVVVSPRISVSEGHEIGNEVSRRLRRAFPALTDLTFHVDPEDDAGEGDPSRFPGLPLRPEVEETLTRHWSNLDVWPRIRDLELHYLDGRITVVAELDEDAPVSSESTRAALHASARDLDWFSHVEIRRLA
ncbi:cation diffusion facilitator family transporter [Halomonas sp.]|jgi:cation diffusion facilitator family transporter|uniref:cation diffusion facilitator family transporter n=1 Tax=Halomonas sp. TaxID=1486246 RepID=UPI003561F638